MWKILSKGDIEDIWKMSGWSVSRIAYALSILMGRSLVERLSNNLYLVKASSDPIRLESIYWGLVQKMIRIYSPSGGVIWWEKALEMHLRDYSIPDVLIIYTRDTAIRVKLVDGREVHFRTLVSGVKTGKKNLWHTIMTASKSIVIPEKLYICGIDLALLEALSIRRHETWIAESGVLKFLRSYGARLDRRILGTLAQHRYIRPINRLRVISRDLGYPDIYAMTLEIIRDEWGGCYLNL